MEENTISNFNFNYQFIDTDFVNTDILEEIESEKFSVEKDIL